MDLETFVYAFNMALTMLAFCLACVYFSHAICVIIQRYWEEKKEYMHDDWVERSEYLTLVQQYRHQREMLEKRSEKEIISGEDTRELHHARREQLRQDESHPIS